MSYKRKLIIWIISASVVIVFITLLGEWINPRRSRATAGSDVQDAQHFAGGTFEASGIAQVSGTNGFLFIDDGRPTEVLWMELGTDGKQAGSIIPVKLETHIDDPEGITTDGSYFYVVGSQSRSKASSQADLVRFRFNKETKSAEDVQSISELKRFLFDNVAELRSLESQDEKDTELDIEGLAWDPTQRSLLLGLRSPVVDKHALVVPLKLRDSGGTFSFSNVDAGSASIRLALGGMGIRSIEYDQRSKVFHIIGGATEGQDKTDFKLWEWSGQTGGSGLRESTTFDRNLQPEGVSSGSFGTESFKVIVFDSSRYLKLP